MNTEIKPLKHMGTIIITTDFSDAAMNAARYAAELSKSIGISTIVLYHSSDIPSLPTTTLAARTKEISMDDSSLISFDTVEKEIRMVLGDDSDIIIDMEANGLPLDVGVEQLATERNAILVVAGTTDKSGIEKFLLGSKTSLLAGSCPVSLLIVPKETKFQPIKKIVFACDLKKVTSRTPVSEIGWWLDSLQAKLLVLNVALEGKRIDPIIMSEQYKIHEFFEEFKPSFHYEEGTDIAEEIATFAENQRADLVITIPKTYGFFEGLFNRSVSNKLIDKAEVPLLLMKEKQ